MNSKEKEGEIEDPLSIVLNESELRTKNVRL